MKLLQRSLVARIIASLLAISAMALISIVVTMTVAGGSRGDAAAINMAGSLRMNTYQIVAALQRYQQQPEAEHRERARALAVRFKERLTSPQLTGAMPGAADHALQVQYRRLLERWDRELAPQVEAAVAGGRIETGELHASLDGLVGEIDALVTLLEENSESKIRLLSALQILFLGLTAVVVAIALYDIRHNLVTPLRQLMVLAREAAHRNFDHRTRLQGHDELAMLGRTLDTMAEELGASYAELEERVSRKKAELERSNLAMQVMHDGSRQLYGGGNDLCSSAAPMLRRLEQLLEIGPIRLSLNDPHDDRQIPILATHSARRPEYCRDHDCHACLIDPRPLRLGETEEGECLLLPVSVGDEMLGTLEVWYPRKQPLTSSTRRLLNALADQLATAVYLQRRIEEQQQVSLMNERTIIARELHDSLAQSLSYLKMQVARLERMQQKDMPREAQAAVFDELRTGLDSAYRQLRELLTTFRLKLEGPGLSSALRQTTAEFAERMAAPIELDVDVPPHLLNPNEEIHVLQVVREALANIHKHARAHWAGVSVRFAEARIRVRIEDDGIGLEDDRSPPMHYGLVIMRDRAETLGGELRLRNRPAGGTLVELVFTPQTARLITQQPASHVPDTATDPVAGHRSADERIALKHHGNRE
ncbi:type IV pili methyl-accepting chemotaxis transducer N-terminal domain-containing protein [Halomonas heilongjiangensis]|uniref:Sensor protein n=1 Tax=Halomonas heilongjiangensis TaxID=1387883 RepID=A0A2N7TIT6_9GAMM|nr:type IV pili methyl-accepting chemotaxis transducer N-terminal domain-containing protein [Halomonas heilongjiangensis]PMR68084.1 nitrate/nitrite sensor protein NarX [Halomonas heilongjiangensis]PXX92164.1 nitrate/nitrite sensor protein NarX [Halomonas heilongjiangensis]